MMAYHRIRIPSALAVLAAAALVACAAAPPGAPGAQADQPGAATASAPAAQAAAATDWPNWFGPAHNGVSAEKGWRTDWTADPPKQLWRKKVGDGFTAPSIAAGRLYTSGNAAEKDTIFCLNPETGDEIWTYSYPCEAGQWPGTRATPAVDGAFIYTFSREGELFCLTADKGELKWRTNLLKECGLAKPMWGFGSQPLVLGDNIIMILGPTIAVNKATGKIAWKSGADKGGYSTPYPFQLGGRTLLAGMNEFGLIVNNAADGKEVARMRWETQRPVHPATPVVRDKRIFISSGYGMGCALTELTDDGLKVLWKNTNMKNHSGTSMLWQDSLYGFDGQMDEGVLRCIDFATGESRWSKDDVKAGSLMLADGKLIIMSSKGDLIAADASPAGYKELGHTHVLEGRCWTMPVLSGGRIYCRSHQGDLVCVDVRKK